MQAQAQQAQRVHQVLTVQELREAEEAMEDLPAVQQRILVPKVLREVLDPTLVVQAAAAAAVLQLPLAIIP